MILHCREIATALIETGFVPEVGSAVGNSAAIAFAGRAARASARFAELRLGSTP